MAPLAPSIINALYSEPTSTYSIPAMPLVTQLSALATIVTPTTPYTPMASPSSISDILHEISKANVAAEPTSTLDLKVKSSSSGAEGGLSTKSVVGIIGGILVGMLILGFIVVKMCHH